MFKEGKFAVVAISISLGFWGKTEKGSGLTATTTAGVQSDAAFIQTGFDVLHILYQE
jgi:hypothetical protein